MFRSSFSLFWRLLASLQSTGCLQKTTGHFCINDRSLLHKRRVVFYQRSITAIILLMNRKWSIEYLCVKKSIFLPLSRAHAHTHYRSFRFFAVTSVTDDLQYPKVQVFTMCMWICFNRWDCFARLTKKKVHREASMFYLCFLRFCSSFSSRWFCDVTLVTAKKQNCCWKARV